MTLSIRERIVANLVDAVASISLPNGYEFNMVRVHRTPLDGTKLVGFPSAAIVEVDEDKEDGSPVPGFTTCMLHLQIMVWNRQILDSEAASKEVNALLANVEKSLKADINRGGLAIDTNLVRNETILPYDAVPYGGVLLFVDVHYRHRFNDPFAQ